MKRLLLNVTLVLMILFSGFVSIVHSEIIWKHGNFVDEFGDTDKEKFLRHDASGVFSNNATTDSCLNVSITFSSKGDIGIFLHEYCSGPGEVLIGGGVMKLKNSNNETINVRLPDKWNNSGGMTVDKKDVPKLVSFIKKSSGYIKCVVNDEYTSVYNFKINSEGFTAEYKAMMERK